MTKRVLMLSCAVGALSLWGGTGWAATATATAAANAADQGASSVGEIVVTAEKREENLQTVPIAITAFTAKERDRIGINSIQDMTNFTPGLTYSTSTDRVTLRGVGRTTNVLSADAPVANYDDGLYETFAVAAGRSSLDLARVEVLRGPQAALYGHSAEAGALNEITQRPTATPFAEARVTYGNYQHWILEGAVSGPLSPDWGFRVYGSWEKQAQGWIKNIVPGQPSEGNNIDEWYAEAQLQGKFGDHLEMWTKIQAAQWFNKSGGPGDQSDGWTPAGYPNYEFSVAATRANAGYACAPGFAANGGYGVVNVSPAGCYNPALSSPWREAMQFDHSVELPMYASLNTHWTYHAPGFDVKYIGGGTYYHYILQGGQTGGNNAPVASYHLGCAFIAAAACQAGNLGLQINPSDSFTYQELNGFFSNELDVISTGSGPFQWIAGLYQYHQAYTQPVSAEDLQQPQDAGPFPSLGPIFCPHTGDVCAPGYLNRWFDNRPAVSDTSLAANAQVDWKITDTLKLTVGARYSQDRKYGSESVRLTCFALPSCYAAPELNAVIPGGIPAVDLTQIPTVVDAGPPGGPLPKGVTTVTTYDPANGLATRDYNSTWSSPTGTIGLEWTPDEDSLYYAKYGHGYKSGGYNIGIYTVLSFEPWTAAEHVDSFELGAKHTFGRWLTLDAAAYWYNYQDLQIPIGVVQTAGGLAQSETSFLNVPKSITRGIELEGTWTPVDNLSVIFSYSFDDAYITQGQAADPADPNAYAPNAKPLYTAAQCEASYLASFTSHATPVCTPDIYTQTAAQAAAIAAAGGPAAPLFSSGPVAGDAGQGWNIPQSLKGNPLPNAPRNKVAVTVLYNLKTSMGTWTPTLSYIWRDKEYGLFFPEANYAAPAWNEVDGRVSYTSPNGKFTAIAFIKNIFNSIGYDQGALATRAAGTSDILQPGGAYVPVNYVQGINGPAGFNNPLAGANSRGVYSTYYVTPPRTYGIELHYKFF